MRTFRGLVWEGGDAEPYDGAVVVDGDTLASVGPDVPRDAEPAGWIGPGLYDAHVHLAFGTFEEMRRGGVLAVRDLGAPPHLARQWRGPDVEVAGPLLTAPGGYPSSSWGADGFARFVRDADDAREAVRELDVDVVKVALEPAGGQPVPAPEVVSAIVDEAHARGLAVTAHALSEPMVVRALDAGVDELCHTPAEPLSRACVERIAAAGIPVVSTIETLGDGAAANANALYDAGVRLVYGTDLGNAGTRPGADPRELRRLAEAGLGPFGAIKAATRETLAHGGPARLVVLDADPRRDLTTWNRPRWVMSAAWPNVT
ncbi:MAG TPA: amidohydrolase family protein [Frankiaceae bacterium]|nr:amidohydrolase family protein [Frankiaceae bacterium]